MENSTNKSVIPAGVKGIIFDYGGTLDTRGDHWSHILEQGWRHAGIEVALPTFRHCYIYAERELARERKNERALAEFEAMRAEAYKYNF